MTSPFKPPTLELSAEKHDTWKTWKGRWDDYAVVTGLAERDETYKCAVLRYTFTEETRKIYESLNLSQKESQICNTIITKLKTFAKGIINETLERHAFNMRNQQDGETVDEFLTDIKVLIKACNFCATCYDGLVRDRVVGGINDDEVRKKLLAKSDLTLKEAEEICKANEKAIQGVKSLGDKTWNCAEANYIKQTGRRKPQYQQYNQNTKAKNSQQQQQRLCNFCAKMHVLGRQYCPAFGKQCLSCGKYNHFAASQLCHQKKDVKISNFNRLEEDEVTVDALFLGSVEQVNTVENWEITMNTRNKNIKFKVDTGADVTVISRHDLEAVGLTIADLRETSKSLIGQGNKKLECLGYTTLKFQLGTKFSKQVVYVCQDIKIALLGKPAINSLELVK